jgi:hypothetical protein
MMGYVSGSSPDPVVAFVTFGGASADTDKLFDALTDHVVATRTKTKISPEIPHFNLRFMMDILV